MTRAFWTAAAILGAVLLQTALSYLVPEPARYFDPFVLVVVYAALAGGESRGMLAGVGAGWVQDALFGGRVLGLSALSKLVVGYAVGLAAGRFLLASAAARALAVFVAALGDAMLVPWLASAFTIEATPIGPLALVARAATTALVGAVFFALAERRRGGRA